MTSLGLSSASDVITIDQNWHHLYSTSAGGKIFQWCPDQSDWPNGAWDMHKNAQNVEWNTQSKISCHYTWLLHGKNCPSQWPFLRSFLTTSKPSRRSITAAKRKKQEKKERRKKFKNRKAQRRRSLSCPRAISKFCLCTRPSQNVMKRDASGKKSKLSCYKCIFDQIKPNLAEI